MSLFQNKSSGHRKVTSTLKKYAFLRSYKVLSDYKFNYKGKIITIDNILIGFFGIMIVTDINVAGEVYIEEGRNTEWLNIENSKKTKFGNPLTESLDYINAIKVMLREQKVANTMVENLIVFTDKKVELYKPNKLPIIKITELSKYIHQSKYDKDNEYDVEQIVEILNKNSASVSRN